MIHIILTDNLFNMISCLLQKSAYLLAIFLWIQLVISTCVLATVPYFFYPAPKIALIVLIYYLVIMYFWISVCSYLQELTGSYELHIAPTSVKTWQPTVLAAALATSTIATPIIVPQIDLLEAHYIGVWLLIFTFFLSIWTNGCVMKRINFNLDEEYLLGQCYNS